jgi:hypothetical protein
MFPVLPVALIVGVTWGLEVQAVTIRPKMTKIKINPLYFMPNLLLFSQFLKYSLGFKWRLNEG